MAASAGSALREAGALRPSPHRFLGTAPLSPRFWHGSWHRGPGTWAFSAPWTRRSPAGVAAPAVVGTRAAALTPPPPPPPPPRPSRRRREGPRRQPGNSALVPLTAGQAPGAAAAASSPRPTPAPSPDGPALRAAEPRCGRRTAGSGVPIAPRVAVSESGNPRCPQPQAVPVAAATGNPPGGTQLETGGAHRALLAAPNPWRGWGTRRASATWLHSASLEYYRASPLRAGSAIPGAGVDGFNRNGWVLSCRGAAGISRIAASEHRTPPGEDAPTASDGKEPGRVPNTASEEWMSSCSPPTCGFITFWSRERRCHSTERPGPSSGRFPTELRCHHVTDGDSRGRAVAGSCLRPVPVHGQIVMRATTGAEGGAGGDGGSHWGPMSLP